MKMNTRMMFVGLLLVSGLAFAEKVEDKKDLRKARENIQQAIREMEKAQAANEFEMGGHGSKAKQLLAEADREIQQAIEAVRSK